MPISVKSAGHRKAAETTHRPRSTTMVRTLSSMALHDRDELQHGVRPCSHAVARLCALCNTGLRSRLLLLHLTFFIVHLRAHAQCEEILSGQALVLVKNYSSAHWGSTKGLRQTGVRLTARAGGRCRPRHLASTPDSRRKRGAGHTRAARRRQRPLPALAHRYQQGHWESRAWALCASPNPLARPGSVALLQGAPACPLLPLLRHLPKPRCPRQSASNPAQPCQSLLCSVLPVASPGLALPAAQPAAGLHVRALRRTSSREHVVPGCRGGTIHGGRGGGARLAALR